LAKETLVIPEENLAEVIRIIRCGLRHSKRVTNDTKHNLTKWCKEESDYLKRLKTGNKTYYGSNLIQSPDNMYIQQG
jgi:hypothetical protein